MSPAAKASNWWCHTGQQFVAALSTGIVLGIIGSAVYGYVTINKLIDNDTRQDTAISALQTSTVNQESRISVLEALKGK